MIAMTKLKSQQNMTPGQAKPTILDSMHYYVFIGHGHMTEDHLKRTMTDMKDRVLYGMDQRWSYFQVSTAYGDLVNLPEEDALRSSSDGDSYSMGPGLRWQ